MPEHALSTVPYELYKETGCGAMVPRHLSPLRRVRRSLLGKRLSEVNLITCTSERLQMPRSAAASRGHDDGLTPLEGW